MHPARGCVWCHRCIPYFLLIPVSLLVLLLYDLVTIMILGLCVICLINNISIQILTLHKHEKVNTHSKAK